MNEGGNGKGYKHTKESLEKNRIAHLKENLSEEVRKKMSNAKKNEETRLRLLSYIQGNQFAKGHKVSDEVRQKMSEGHKGLYVGDKAPWAKCVVVLTLDGEYVEEFTCIHYAVLKYNASSSAISACCKGKRNKHKGFKWLYKDDYLKLIEGRGWIQND